MEKKHCDSYCGIYCGACSIRVAYETGVKDHFAEYWTESTLRSSLHDRGIEVTDSRSLRLECQGCKTDTLFINCRYCKIRECAREKKVEHCNLCEKYPCTLFHESLLNEKVQQLLPHLKENTKNLEEIQKKGLDQWLSEQEKRWACPRCNTPRSWYSTHCSHCGNELPENNK